jgi:hypothetical protein
MRLGWALSALLALASPAAFAQQAIVQLPDRVYTAVPFMIDIQLDCPPPDEAPPPIGCNGTTGAWFEISDNSGRGPKGFVTLFPHASVRAGPFTFHKPGRQFIAILSRSREFLGEVNVVAEVDFQVEPPGQVHRN